VTKETVAGSLVKCNHKETLHLEPGSCCLQVCAVMLIVEVEDRPKRNVVDRIIIFK
jgi:hypothetical protein